MQNLKNFKIYEPVINNENRAGLKVLIDAGVIFLKSENGLDWYEVQKEFQDDSFKFTYDEKGIVRSISYDVSGLWPEGKNVAEIPDSEKTKLVDVNGGWVFDGENIIPREYTKEEKESLINDEKAYRIAAASKIIAPLQDALDLEMATEEEKARLMSWKKYRVMLSRVNLDEPSWPDTPE